MNPDTGIFFGIFEGFTWIRIEGKGSFLQSPALKECAEKRQSEGERCFVIDLERCQGMDSTFMGYLAGLASRLRRQGGGVAIAAAGPRNRQSLEDLGLDCLLAIEPEDADWKDDESRYRDGLQPFGGKRVPPMSDHAKHVLESHRYLASTSEDNARRFEKVIEVMEKNAGREGRRD